MSVQTLFYPNDYIIYADTGIFNNLSLSGSSVSGTGNIIAQNITALNTFTAPGNTIDNTGLLTSAFLVANNGVINNFISASGTIENFNSVSGIIQNLTTGNLLSYSGHFTQLSVNQETIRSLSAQSINSLSGGFTHLFAHNALIDTLSAGIINSVSGSVDNLISNNLDVMNLLCLSGNFDLLISSSGYFANVGANAGIITTLSDSTINSISGHIHNFASVNSLITNISNASFNSISGYINNLGCTTAIINNLTTDNLTLSGLVTITNSIITTLSDSNINSVSGFITNFGSTNSIITTLSDSNINSISGFINNLGVNDINAQTLESVSGSITNFISTNSIINTLSGQSINSVSGFIQNLLVTNIDGNPYPIQSAWTPTFQSGGAHGNITTPATGTGYYTKWNNIIQGYFLMPGCSITTGATLTYFYLSVPISISGVASNNPVGIVTSTNAGNSFCTATGNLNNLSTFFFVSYTAGASDTGITANLYGSFMYHG